MIDAVPEGTAEFVRGVLAEHGLAAGVVRPLGAGLDHAAYEVDGELVVRLVSDNDAAADVGREARLLASVAGVVPLAVPVPVLVDVDRGCLAYRKLPGVPAIGLNGTLSHAADLGAALGEFLKVLHAIAPETLADLVDVDDAPLTEWLADAAESTSALGNRLPSRYRRGVDTFLSTPPPTQDGRGVLAHNDLGIEHVLIDPGTWRVTGVIDWSDAALTDPARDLGLILRDLGLAALDAALAVYGNAEGLAERALFFARCGAIEDLAYGLQTGRNVYADKSARSFSWLFETGG